MNFVKNEKAVPLLFWLLHAPVALELFKGILYCFTLDGAGLQYPLASSLYAKLS